MGDCPNAEMRDALPELMFDEMEASHRATVQAHVNECHDCAAELALLQRVRKGVASPAVDVQRIVQALPAHRRRTVWAQPALRMAAALALLIGGATWYGNREPASIFAGTSRVARRTRSRSATSAAHSAQPATCASTRARSAAFMSGRMRSGSASRISTFGQSPMD